MSTERPLLVSCPGCGYEGILWEHDCRGRRRQAVLEAGLVVGRHWLDQEGVNAVYLDALGDAVRLHDSEPCEVCRAWFSQRELKEHVVDCPGPRSILESRCDECDPSFGCFSAPERCCKKVSPP